MLAMRHIREALTQRALRVPVWYESVMKRAGKITGDLADWELPSPERGVENLIEILRQRQLGSNSTPIH
jgi:hypothetical protein